MYALLPSLVLGFHGCDRDVGEAVLAGHAMLRQSANDHDWLGSGTYFWENSPDRALSYATLLKQRSTRAVQPIRSPFVVGAILHPGHCLNLTDELALREVGTAYEALCASLAAAGLALPSNMPGYAGDEDLLRRNLDCAVFRVLHELRRERQLQPYDTVRSPFQEGLHVYRGAGFRRETHVQLCIRNPCCIKGYFRPLTRDGTPLQAPLPA